MEERTSSDTQFDFILAAGDRRDSQELYEIKKKEPEDQKKKHGKEVCIFVLMNPGKQDETAQQLHHVSLPCLIN